MYILERCAKGILYIHRVFYVNIGKFEVHFGKTWKSIVYIYNVLLKYIPFLSECPNLHKY
jgi:hypothetical protein